MNLEYCGKPESPVDMEEARDYFRKLFRAPGALTRFSDRWQTRATRGALCPGDHLFVCMSAVVFVTTDLPTFSCRDFKGRASLVRLCIVVVV